jgi:hypothetical protein
VGRLAATPLQRSLVSSRDEDAAMNDARCAMTITSEEETTGCVDWLVRSHLPRYNDQCRLLSAGGRWVDIELYEDSQCVSEFAQRTPPNDNRSDPGSATISETRP